MKYQKLSEVIALLDNPQRSDRFVKHLRTAVLEGEIDAVYLPERCTLPKEFQRRGAAGKYQRSAREMLIEVTPAFERWLVETSVALASRRNVRTVVSAQSIEAGEVDFKALAEETRRKMQASYKKGQALGLSRGKAAQPKGWPKAKGKAPARKK
ncbi:hypothetical protein [Deinococcus sp. QL22]|uniref:hypothetical protein n=1 Tax=Deinococcus sp. QL22 TaxID=2939437 RepID=UPI0020170B36|nr:hypothetical protein [Deinococcus sp. QL22]UQN08028.1 hypothetical protein M1R55_18220 [Deinococcus sp. QL22]